MGRKIAKILTKGAREAIERPVKQEKENVSGKKFRIALTKWRLLSLWNI
jgi:hypothetical protein